MALYSLLYLRYFFHVLHTVYKRNEVGVLQEIVQKTPLLETTKRNISVWLIVTAMAMTTNLQGKSNILFNFILYQRLNSHLREMLVQR